eukprot:366061-Chlamydomonas_euryale.AAC.2
MRRLAQSTAVHGGPFGKHRLRLGPFGAHTPPWQAALQLSAQPRSAPGRRRPARGNACKRQCLQGAMHAREGNACKGNACLQEAMPARCNAY